MFTALALLFALNVADIMVHYGTGAIGVEPMVITLRRAQNFPERVRFLIR